MAAPRGDPGKWAGEKASRSRSSSRSGSDKPDLVVYTPAVPVDFEELNHLINTGIDYVGDIKHPNSFCDQWVPTALVDRSEEILKERFASIKFGEPIITEDYVRWVAKGAHMAFWGTGRDEIGFTELGFIDFGDICLFAGNIQGHPFVNAPTFSYGNSDGSGSSRILCWADNERTEIADSSKAFANLLEDARTIAMNEEH